MHVISRKKLVSACTRDRSLERPLADWFKIASSANWCSIVDVRKTYPTADFVEPFTVFNIRGNTFRLIVKIEYKWKLVFIKDVLTHAEYERWSHERTRN